MGPKTFPIDAVPNCWIKNNAIIIPETIGMVGKSGYIALGNGSFNLSSEELKSLKFKRSLIYVKDLKKGEKVNEFNVRALRPNIGISPINFYKIIGKSVNRNISIGEGVKLEDFDES